MKISRGKLLILAALFLAGCAAQNAHQAYFEAEYLVKEAMTKVGTNDPVASLAYDNLAKGKVEMMDAKYDLAIRHFRESIRLSREVNDVKGKGVPQAEHIQIISTPQPVAVVAPPPPPPPQPPAPPPPQAVPPPPPARPVQPASTQANEALAKYLAAKKNAQPAPAAPKAVEKPLPVKVVEPAPVPVAAPVVLEEKPVVQTDTQRETLDEKPLSTNTVVIAPSAPVIKPPPKPKDDDVLEEALAKAKNGKPEVTAGGRRKLPDNIPFIVDDPSIITEALATLNQSAKFLLENPSASLLFEGQLAGQEANKLLAERFESVKSYLVGKGVPEDQIQLDEHAKRGKNPEFQMFIVEH